MANALMPRTVALVNEWLKAQPAITAVCGKRISYALGGTYPAIRLADIGPITRGPEEALRRIQVECWADDYDTAERLAATVESVLPEAVGAWPSGYCAGGSVESGPFASPDPNSVRYRHQLDVALWLYPSTI
ncbi:MAG: hypothetical protein ACR2JO_08065 [Mycobacteriales bacterium]